MAAASPASLTQASPKPTQSPSQVAAAVQEVAVMEGLAVSQLAQPATTMLALAAAVVVVHKQQQEQAAVTAAVVQECKVVAIKRI